MVLGHFGAVSTMHFGAVDMELGHCGTVGMMLGQREIWCRTLWRGRYDARALFRGKYDARILWCIQNGARNFGRCQYSTKTPCRGH